MLSRNCKQLNTIRANKDWEWQEKKLERLAEYKYERPFRITKQGAMYPETAGKPMQDSSAGKHALQLSPCRSLQGQDDSFWKHSVGLSLQVRKTSQMWANQTQGTGTKQSLGTQQTWESNRACQHHQVLAFLKYQACGLNHQNYSSSCENILQ